MGIDENSISQDLDTLTYCLNNLAWVPIGIRPGKYRGPVDNARIRHRQAKGVWPRDTYNPPTARIIKKMSILMKSDLCCQSCEVVVPKEGFP